jgi:hypothetical protein
MASGFESSVGVIAAGRSLARSCGVLKGKPQMFEFVVESVSVENGRVLLIGYVSSGDIHLGAKIRAIVSSQSERKFDCDSASPTIKEIVTYRKQLQVLSSSWNGRLWLDGISANEISAKDRLFGENTGNEIS